MLLLKGIGGIDASFCLLPDKEYKLGRKDCDILLPNDASISRKHAVIKIEGSSANDFKITLSDHSKYGVTVNGKRVASSVCLKDKDEVLFGQCQHKYRLIHHPLVVTMSCINDSEKKTRLKSIINQLGGTVVNEWNNQCTHLIMEKVTFTVKTVCALAKGCPIVTPKFLEDCAESYKEPSNELVVASKYFPEIAEPSLKGNEKLFQPNIERRKKLFHDKRFIFLSKKQCKRLSPAVLMTGGTVSLRENRDETTAATAIEYDSIVLAPEAKDEKSASRDQTDWIKHVMDRLNASGLRSIKESEVGLAILNMSLETYCNPRSDSENSMAGTTNSQIMQDTMLEFTSQWHSTFKDRSPEPFNPPEVAEFKKPSILASDSQIDADKKRKRSSETSMYIPDTVPMDTLPFHLAKRPKKKSSNDSESEDPSKNHLETTSKPFGVTVPDSFSKERHENRHAALAIDSQQSGNTSNIICKDSLVAGKEKALLVLDSSESDGGVVNDTGMRNRTHHNHIAANTKDGTSKKRSNSWKNTSDEFDSKKVKLEDDCDDPFAMTSHVIVANTEVSRLGESSRSACLGSERSRANESLLTERFDDTNEIRRPENVDVKPVRVDVVSQEDGGGNFEGERITKDHNVNLFGFLSSNMTRPKIEKVEMEEDSEMVDASTVVRFASLVKRIAAVRPVYTQPSNVKNFKKFNKAYFPGKDLSIPNIIGGRDLVVFQSQDENKETAFADFRAIDEEREKQEKYIDDLFNWNPDNTKRRKR